jgi:hypothetical protein
MSVYKHTEATPGRFEKDQARAQVDSCVEECERQSSGRFASTISPRHPAVHQERNQQIHQRPLQDRVRPIGNAGWKLKWKMHRECPPPIDSGSTIAATVNFTSMPSASGRRCKFHHRPWGPNQTTIPLARAFLVWPDGILTSSSQHALSFTPGDPTATTAVSLYTYTAVYNATVAIGCLAAPGASSFTVPSDLLSLIPATYLSSHWLGQSVVLQ